MDDEKLKDLMENLERLRRTMKVDLEDPNLSVDTKATLTLAHALQSDAVSALTTMNTNMWNALTNLNNNLVVMSTNIARSTFWISLWLFALCALLFFRVHW